MTTSCSLSSLRSTSARSASDGSAAFDRLYAQARRMAEGLARHTATDLRAEACGVVEALSEPGIEPAGVWHPYGFFVVKVAVFPDLGALRLHVWSDLERRVQQPCWPVHCHRWNLESYVLAGAIDNTWYGADEGGNLPLYAATRRGTESVMTRTRRRITLHPLAYQRVRAGCDYTVGTRTFHDTNVPEGTFTATLALTTLEGGGFEAFVAGDPEGERSYVYPREAVQPCLVAGSLQRILEEGQ